MGDCDHCAAGSTGAPAWVVIVTGAFMYITVLPLLMVLRPNHSSTRACDP